MRKAMDELFDRVNADQVHNQEMLNNNRKPPPKPITINNVAGGVCLGLWLFLLTLLPVAFCVWLVLMFLSHR